MTVYGMGHRRRSQARALRRYMMRDKRSLLHKWESGIHALLYSWFPVRWRSDKGKRGFAWLKCTKQPAAYPSSIFEPRNSILVIS